MRRVAPLLLVAQRCVSFSRLKSVATRSTPIWSAGIWSLTDAAARGVVLPYRCNVVRARAGAEAGEVGGECKPGLGEGGAPGPWRFVLLAAPSK
jgi:hypothetical protein